MRNSFYTIYNLIHKNKGISLLTALIFLVGSFWVIKNIQFNEDIYKVIPTENRTTATHIIQKMSFADKITVIISAKGVEDEDMLADVAHAFIDTLTAHNNYYHDIQGVLDPEYFQKGFQFVYNHLPIYLNEDDYKVIEKKLHPDSIKRQIDRNYALLSGSSGVFMKEIMLYDPLWFSLLALKKLQQLQGDNEFVFESGYLYSKNKDKLFMFINPKYPSSDTKNNEDFVAKLKGIQSALEKDFPEINIHYFGASFIAVANAQQIKQDILVTVTISIGVLMLLLIFYYRRWEVPILVMIPSLFGGILGLLCLSLVRSDISAVSLSVSAILVGITIDYALHFLTHSKASQDKQAVFRDVTKPLFMSSITTAIAFLCLLFVRSEALIDLGIFASVSTVASAGFTLVILPHLYRGEAIQHNHIIDSIAAYPFEKNKWLIGISVLLAIISLFTWKHTGLDGDLSKINYLPKDQQEAEKLLYHNQEVLKKLFIISYGNNEEVLLQQNAQIKSWLDTQKLVTNIQSVSVLVPDPLNQAKAIRHWEDFWTEERKKNTIAIIESASEEKGFVEKAYAPFYELLNKNYSGITLDSLNSFDPQLYREFVHKDSAEIILSTLIQVHPKSRNEFVDDFEKIYQKKQALVIDRQAVNEQYLGYLLRDFNNLISYSFIAVIVILFAFYRRIELVITALVPIALTAFITAGMMGLLRVDFNIFSMIVCTLVFGHGIDFTIFMTNALLKEYTTGENEVPLYRTSILLAVLTTILAIGALLFAKHPALKSISLVALVGVATAVLVTFVLYPILFRFFFLNRVKKGLCPITLSLLVFSTWSLFYFAMTSLLSTFFIRFVLDFMPISKERKLSLSTRLMSWYMTFKLYTKWNIHKKIYNKHLIPKNQPTIFIANHSSFLDILCMSMLHPKTIFIVNDWVFNSPFFGNAVRYMGFIPISQGIKKNTESLRDKVNKGFSLMIFPEGTRSSTTTIDRFHKGAFYLSELLNIPITPVYLHGNGEALPKGDFIIYKGYTHVHVGEPIYPDNKGFGDSYTERTKQISSWFKNNFRSIRLQYEHENFFRQKLLLNYLYKEYNLHKKVKDDFKKHNTIYFKLFKNINEKANIAHITTDYGQVDFILLHQFPSRIVTTYNPIVSHRNISKTSYIVRKFQITYVDSIDELWTNQDTLLLSKISEIRFPIPSHIQRIIVLCSEIDEKFVDFSTEYQEEDFIIYQRNEAKNGL